MDISSLGHTVYYKNESISNNRDEKTGSAEQSQVNNLNAIYVDPDALSDLRLKSAHTSEILMKKNKEIQENRPLQDVNFEKESKKFDKSNIESLSGSLKNSQASFISSKRVSELLK